MAILIVIGLSVSSCASTAPRNAGDICAVFSEERTWHRDAVNAEKKWGTSMHIPLAIMYQESTFRAKARPPRTKLLGFIPWRRVSSAYGFAQAIDGTWREYMADTGEYWRVRHDFTDANDFIHWYIREAGRINGIPNADAYNLYLNYHEGPSGFSRGTHKRKPWLLKAATGVQTRSQRYATQYRGCQASLKPNFLEKLIGW